LALLNRIRLGRNFRRIADVDMAAPFNLSM